MTAHPDSPQNQLETLRAALGAQYTVERLLGQGGMGSVYLARDVTLDRPVAIKVINPDGGGNSTLRERFLQEARTVAKLRHPNIVPVYAAGEAGGMLYFVMEFVPGESLREVLSREGRVDPERAERIIREVALALDHANAQGLVHRDVKPENILLDGESGRAMLTDFGVSRAFEHAGDMTQAGMILGSPRYMSPEQASGERALDGRSDLYSLALIGYEMFTGAPVVQSATVAGMLVKHITETPPPLAEKASSIPPQVAAAVDRGLAKNPDERWQTGRQFAEAIAGHGLTPTGVMRGAGPAHPSRRRSTIFAGLGVVAAAALWFVFGRSAPVGKGFLVAPFEIQSGDASVTWLHEGSVNMLTLIFGQWADLNVVDYERTLSLLDAEGLADKPRLSLDDAFKLARRAGAGTVVTGQVQTTRDSLIIVAKLYDVGTAKSTTQAQEGIALNADPRPLFDRLAQQLLSISGGRTSTVQLAQATTSSLSAYRAYLDGLKHLNQWQLAEADLDFARATALDSTFAIAFHKRSLGLGWSQVGGTEYVQSADRAFALADRVPLRERSLIEGHYHLTHALSAGNARDTATTRIEYAASIKAYTDLISRGDSLAAEAWYGLADAYFHGRFGIAGFPNDSLREYTTRSLRGFNKTLAIDSTYHLAYSHLVQLYNATAQGSNLLISGDSTLMIVEETDITRFGGPAAVQRFRDAAAARGVTIARAWARADDQSSQPILQLSQSLAAARQPDSASAVLAEALKRPSVANPAIRLALLGSQLTRGDSGAASTLHYILDHYTADSLHLIQSGQRFGSSGAMMTVAASLGRSADLDRAAALFLASDSTLPFTTAPSAPVLSVYRLALGLAMGDSLTADRRRTLLNTMHAFEVPGSVVNQQARSGSQSLPYLAFLVSRDTAFRSFITRWFAPGVALPELDALGALARGDSAAARKLVELFPRPDSLRKPEVRFGVGGMRSIARAQVLAALRLTRQAAETYEATTVDRINGAGLAEPGYALWVRSWLERARLWAELGERDKAITAYEEFLRRWKDADGVAAKQVGQARQELGRLKDAPR